MKVSVVSSPRTCSEDGAVGKYYNYGTNGTIDVNDMRGASDMIRSVWVCPTDRTVFIYLTA